MSAVPVEITIFVGAILCMLFGGLGAHWLRSSKPKILSGAKANFTANYRSDLPKLPDATDQLRFVMSANFTPTKLLSKSEARVLYTAESVIAEAGLKWRVMAQVNLGEILRCADRKAFAAINSKRVDLLIITSTGDPVAAIEYQGSGHYISSAAARDAVKKEALRRAGIGYIEVTTGDTPKDIRSALARLIEQTPSKTA